MRGPSVSRQHVDVRMHRKARLCNRVIYRALHNNIVTTRPSAHTTERLACAMAQSAERGGAEVGQLVMFPVRPQKLHLVQFRSAGGQELRRESTVLLTREVPHQMAAVTSQAVPKQSAAFPRRWRRSCSRNSTTRRLRIVPETAGSRSLFVFGTSESL